MIFKRQYYLDKLIKYMKQDTVKIITGLRRSGKSFFLANIFIPYLKGIGVDDKHIIYMQMDFIENEEFLNYKKLYEYIKSKLKDKKYYYVIFDEIQYVDNFWIVLNSLRMIKNVDVYCTGSNSKFLSKDIVTEYRGRSIEIHLLPLTFKEYYEEVKGDIWKSFDSYLTYGGLPVIQCLETDKEKSIYLKNIFSETYLKDIVEKNGIKNIESMEDIINILASSIGSYTNPNKIADTFNSKIKNDKDVYNKVSIKKYIEYLKNAFLISEVQRYDIKGRRYINSPKKYYFEDIGLRNARINFRQDEKNHIMENIIYNELIYREYNVDIGNIEINEKQTSGIYQRKQLEVDFVLNQGHKRYYVQSAFEMSTDEKKEQEYKSLRKIDDSFKKFVIRFDSNGIYINDYGIINIGLFDFLLNEDCFSFE